MPDQWIQMEAPKKGLQEARQAFEAGTAIFVDVRGAETYRRAHIPGSISMPIKDLFRQSDRLPRDKGIIFV